MHELHDLFVLGGAGPRQARVLFEEEFGRTLTHTKLRFTNDDAKAGVVPVPLAFHTGTYTVTRANVDAFLRA